MSLELYVGNYPTDFTEEDIKNLFRNFNGIIVRKLCKKNIKSFCFLCCKDIDQLVSVIQSMNGTYVHGRKLKVKATDKSVQNYVNIRLKNTNEDVNPDVQNAALGKASKDVNYFEESTPFEKTNYNKHEAGCTPTVSFRVMRNELPRNKEQSFRQPYKKEYHPKQNYKQDASMQQYEKDVTKNIPNSPTQSLSKIEHDAPSTIDTESYATAHVNQSTKSSMSSRNSHGKYSSAQHNDTKYTWLSVTNFPLGTSTRSIYELFSDYKPIKVKIICNTPRFDRTLTEAHVCFPNRSIADDVILSFDNTIFNGRIILVTDIDDLTIMNELLDIFHF